MAFYDNYDQTLITALENEAKNIEVSAPRVQLPAGNYQGLINEVKIVENKKYADDVMQKGMEDAHQHALIIELVVLSGEYKDAKISKYLPISFKSMDGLVRDLGTLGRPFETFEKLDMEVLSGDFLDTVVDFAVKVNKAKSGKEYHNVFINKSHGKRGFTEVDPNEEKLPWEM